MHIWTHPHPCITWRIHIYAYHDTSTSMHTITHPPLCIQWHIHAFHDAFIQLTHAYNGTSTHTITQYKQRDSWNVRFCNFLYNAYINKFAINENFIKNSCIYSLQIVFHTSLKYSLSFFLLFSIHYQTLVHYLWHVYDFMLFPTKCLI